MKRFIVLLIICVMCGAGCAGARWENASVTRHDQYTISLQHRIEGDRVIEQKYRHPAKIQVGTMVRLLKDLTYLAETPFFGKPEETPVFQDIEIARLAPELSITFESATPNQRIHFTSFNRGGGFIFKDQRKTEGVLFVDADNKLNIAFSWVNEPINWGEDSQARMNASEREALKLDRSNSPLVADKPYMRHHLMENGQKAPLWLVADLEALRQAPAATINPSAPPAPEETVPGQEDPTIAEEPSPPEETAIEPATQQPAPVEPSDGKWDDKKERIRSRLEYLKSLHEEGLISGDEYEAKKRQILEEIE